MSGKTYVAKRMKWMSLLAAVMAAAILNAMTITDRSVVFACPHCGAKAHERELGSYNTFGSVYWSDLFVISPMAPTPNIVARCWKCKKAFDRASAKTTTVKSDAIPENSKDNPRIDWVGDFATVKEVLDAGKGKLNAEREAELRLRMLWAGNHQKRLAGAKGEEKENFKHYCKTAAVPEAEVKANLRRMLVMSDVPTWFKPELLRELGDFEGAQKALDEFQKKSPTEYANNKGFLSPIQDRIKKKDSQVFQCK